jgi:hypothetical protein
MPTNQPTFAKFGPPKREKYLEALAAGARRGAAAESVGVSAELVRQYRHHSAEFDRLVLEAEDEANELVEGALFKAAVEGNVVACQVWLYNRAPDRWADRRNIHRAGPSDPIDLSNMSHEEQFELLREAREEADRRLRLIDGG